MAQAKIKWKIQTTQAVIRRAIDSSLDKIGQYVVKQIKGETRRGNEIITDGSTAAQKPLKKPSIENRKRLEDYNNTHSTYSPDRSNLTFSGQLLDAVTYKLSSKQNQDIVSIYVDDSTRRPYVTSKKGKKSKPLKNSDLAEFQLEKGRKFIGINKQMKEEILNLITQAIRRSIKKI